MVGDYNYPVFKENLGQHVRESGYELTLSDARTYTRYKFFRGHYDFATSVGFDIATITTLPQGRSDHLPILITAEPRALAPRTPDPLCHGPRSCGRGCRGVAWRHRSQRRDESWSRRSSWR
jgi:hypothetical protein